MSPRIRAALVGAGRRSFSAHFPALKRLRDEVEIAALCELDPERLARGGDYFELPAERRYHDLATMLEQARPEVVYAVMWPHLLRPVVEQCFAAGAHVVMEKPPGCTLEDVEGMIAAARAAGRQGMVAFQRRHAAILQEARRRILERGPLTLCVAEFHKDLVRHGPPFYGVSTLWDDAVHVVDLTRYLCGGSVAAVHAYADAQFVDWPNSFQALVRFDNGATALIAASRFSGGRFMRLEAHGREIAAYMDDFPDAVRFLADDTTRPEVLTGAQLAGSDERQAHDGVLEMHRHFLACAREGRPATSSLEDALETMRLVVRMERGELGGSEAQR